MQTVDPALFADLRAYCMFVGYARSGHTLVGSLLDAHEKALIAHELDALRFVDAGVDREELFGALLHQSLAFTRGGRSWSGYRYHVPHQWHGRVSALEVLGDKKGGRSTLRLLQKPDLLYRLRDVVRLPLRLVHVVRNPWDVVATMYRKRRDERRPLKDFVSEFFTACRTNDVLRAELGPDEFFDLRHEDVIAAPEESLRRLCAFVGLEVGEDYLADCASIVYEEPHASRFELDWPAGVVDAVGEAAAEYEFLRGYTYAA